MITAYSGAEKVSYVVVTSKPRVVPLSIKPDGEDRALVGGIDRRANRFNLHVEIGGVAGMIAPAFGKQPSDTKLWIMDGDVPAFVKMEGALYDKGPIWTMVLTSPASPSNSIVIEPLAGTDKQSDQRPFHCGMLITKSEATKRQIQLSRGR